MIAEPILFILGPSGSGKTTLGDYLAEKIGWLHIDFDQHPVNGVNQEGLRLEWDALLDDLNPELLADSIRRRLREKGGIGAAITCPSGVVFRTDYLQVMKPLGYRCVILYGTRDECIESFLRREEHTGRRIGGVDWWNVNNANVHAVFGSTEFDEYRLKAFSEGHHRPLSEMSAEVLNRLDK